MNSTKNHETFKSTVGVYPVFYVTEEGCVRREGKEEVGCGKNFPLVRLFQNLINVHNPL